MSENADSTGNCRFYSYDVSCFVQLYLSENQICQKSPGRSSFSSWSWLFWGYSPWNPYDITMFIGSPVPHGISTRSFPQSLPYHFCQALHSRPALSGQIRQGETHRKAFPAAKASRYRKKWRFQCAKSIERHVTISNPQWIVFAEQITGYIWNILHVSLVWTSYIFILKYCLGFKTSGNHYWLPEATWQ